MADRNVKQRQARGEKHGMAKITTATARFIKRARGKQDDIAARFGISQASVWAIKAGVNWSSLSKDT